ncbi:MAG TPA: GAF domain-containing protein [Candidatus Baltobacteraceae bacterium]|jgi:hypothetical protein
MNRTLGALLVGLITFLCIADIGAGYLDFGQLPNLGTLQRLDPSRSVYTTVTSAGAAAGIRPGDVADLRLVDVTSRYMVASLIHASGPAMGAIDVPLLRNGAVIYAHERFERRAPILLDLLDMVMRILLAAAGVFLIARGTAKDSLYAGLFVCSLSVYEGFAVRYWGPPWVPVLMNVFEVTVVAFGVFGARILFAFELLPKLTPRLLRGGLAALCAAALIAFTVCSFGDRLGAIFGSTYFTTPQYWITQMLLGYSGVLVFAVAAFYARGRTAEAVRWIFAAMLFSQIGPTANWISGITGQPLLAGGALNITYLALAIVLPYAVLARGLVAVDFVFSRAVTYTLVLSVIVGVFIVAEQIVERAALGRVQSTVLELLVPLLLGFSIKWIEASVERLVEQVLYRDKLRAAAELGALVDDFPHARDVRALSGRVAHEIHRLMHAPFVCIYIETETTYTPAAQAGHGEAFPVNADDPVFMRLRSKHVPVHTDDFATALPRLAAVFPLVVFGTVTGAVFAQYRDSGERFDPDELETLTRLSHELAIALLWIERAPQSQVARQV